MRFSYLTHLECPRDGRSYDAGVPQKVCGCGSPLLARYDLKALAEAVTRDQISAGPPSLWYSDTIDGPTMENEPFSLPMAEFCEPHVVLMPSGGGGWMK